MSDPFGAIATQVIGDLGIHIGQGSWAGSAHMTANVAGIINGPFAPGKPTLAPGSGLGPNTPSRLAIYDGSTTHPVTTDAPSVLISRISAFNAPPAQNDALFVFHMSASPANHATNTAVRGYSIQTDIGDSVGVEGTAIIDSTATGTGQVAYGLYGNAVDLKGSGYTVGANPTNQVVSSVPYASPGTVGSYSCFAQATLGVGGSAGHAYLVSAAYAIYANTPADVAYDVGFVAGQGVKNTSFRDDTDSVTSLGIHGTHTYCIDLSASTASTFQILFANNQYINGAGGDLQIVWGLGTGGFGIQQFANSVNEHRFSYNGVILATFKGGTPGANNTAAFFLEGATPTLRQLKTFDPGNLGVNFTAGQLVCVLV